MRWCWVAIANGAGGDLGSNRGVKSNARAACRRLKNQRPGDVTDRRCIIAAGGRANAGDRSAASTRDLTVYMH